MKPITYLALILFFSLTITTLEVRADVEAFKTMHCNKCHEISSLKIGLDKKGGDEEEEEEEEDAPDLSNAGKFHDIAYFKGFLMKETTHTAHDGNKSVKKHPKKFKGTDTELGAMSQWLATLK